MKKLLIALLLAPLAAFAAPATPINNARITGVSSAVTFGIGTGATTPATNFQVVDTGTGTPRGISDDQYNNGTNSAQFNARKARGTFAAPATIVTGDVLARFIAWGHDGSNFIETGNLRFTSEGTIAATRVPSKFEIFVGTDAAPTVLTSTASFSGSNGISFTALGTNQSITLTPSGTGDSRNVLGTMQGTFHNQANGTYTGLYLLSAATARADGNFTVLSNGTDSYINAPGSGGSVYVKTSANGTQNAQFVGTHLLLGGLTGDGTGVLQFPDSTTTAGGITFGTTTPLHIYRVGNGLLQVDATTIYAKQLVAYLGGGTASNVDYGVGNSTGNGMYGTNTTLNFASSGVLALTLDSSQNATFAQTISTGGGSQFKITAVNSVSPTSPNRTITITYGGTTYYIAAKTTND